jgi:hypothetical protein
MKPGSVAQSVHTVLPHLSLRAQAIVDALLLTGGSIGTAGEIAPYIGERNRFGLARLLRREGLPPLHDLAGWARVLSWLETAEQSGCSLCQLAFRSKKDPAVCYRTVKRITGLGWVELKRRGSRRLIADFIAHCRGRGI